MPAAIAMKNLRPKAGVPAAKYNITMRQKALMRWGRKPIRFLASAIRRKQTTQA
jgi:hypothetical protein